MSKKQKNPKVFYVYLHVCPKTKEVVYVGKGTSGRAWDVTRARAGYEEHQQWMLSLIAEGFLPHEWVEILHRGLTESEAFGKEKEYLYSNGRTRFNRYSGERQHQAKLTDLQAIEIYRAAWTTDEPHKSIAERYGICRTSVSMIKHKRQWRTTLAGVSIED